jgi:hypothetical protein
MTRKLKKVAVCLNVEAVKTGFSPITSESAAAMTLIDQEVTVCKKTPPLPWREPQEGQVMSAFGSSIDGSCSVARFQGSV